MNTKIIVIITCLFFNHITFSWIDSSEGDTFLNRTDMHDCLKMAQQAESENNSLFGSFERAQEIIQAMRNCNCAERAKRLDKYTTLHRQVEKKCIELITQAQCKIEAWFPDQTSRKQAIIFMQIAEALGVQHLARKRSVELEKKYFEISNQENSYLEENNKRLYLIRLLKKIVS